MKRHNHLFEKIACVENMERATDNAAKCRGTHRDVAAFLADRENNIRSIVEELRDESYTMGDYHEFFVYDPKKRLVMSLPFRDRVVQWGIYRILNPIFDKRYINTSFACRNGYGAHSAVLKLKEYSHELDTFYDKAYYLKMDVLKYFYRINHRILVDIINSIISDKRVQELLTYIISNDERRFGMEIEDHIVTGNRIRGVGMPIGNLTSQMFANLYLNVLDQYCKQELRIKKYIRYMDDVIVVDSDKIKLQYYKMMIKEFLWKYLELELNDKTCISTCKSGIDFCGYRTYPNYIRMRKSTFDNMMYRIKNIQAMYLDGKIDKRIMQQTMASYYGCLKHCNSYNIRLKLFGHTGRPSIGGIFDTPYIINDSVFDRK